MDIKKGSLLVGVVLVGLGVLLLFIFVFPILTRQRIRVFDASQERKVGGVFGENIAKTSIEAISSNPGSFMGKIVILEDEVGEVVGNRILTLEAPGISPDNNLLVVTRYDLINQYGSHMYSNFDRLRVTGMVSRFSRSELERDLGIDFGTRADVFEGRVYVLADEITLVTNTQSN